MVVQRGRLIQRIGDVDKQRVSRIDLDRRWPMDVLAMIDSEQAHVRPRAIYADDTTFMKAIWICCGVRYVPPDLMNSRQHRTQSRSKCDCSDEHGGR